MARKRIDTTIPSTRALKAKTKKPPLPSEPAKFDSRPGRRIWTPRQTAEQMAWVEAMLIEGASHHQIAKQARDAIGVGETRVATLISRVLDRWDVETSKDDGRRHAKQAQIARIHRYIQWAKGRRDPNNPNLWIEKPNHAALAKWEELLSKVQGTQAPIEIDLNIQHTEVMVQVFARYSLDQLTSLHEEAERKHRLAEAYLAEHPEERDVITVEADAASSGS